MLGYSPWLVDWSVFGESQLIPVLCFAEALVDSRLLAGYLLGYSLTRPAAGAVVVVL